MEKRYPRGKLYTTTKWNGVIENIELAHGGIFYNLVGSNTTTFIPLSSVERLVYDTPPQEIIDAITKQQQ